MYEILGITILRLTNHYADKKDDIQYKGYDVEIKSINECFFDLEELCWGDNTIFDFTKENNESYYLQYHKKPKEIS